MLPCVGLVCGSCDRPTYRGVGLKLVCVLLGRVMFLCVGCVGLSYDRSHDVSFRHIRWVSALDSTYLELPVVLGCFILCRIGLHCVLLVWDGFGHCCLD